MSPVEIMALVGAGPTSPSQGEVADASAFEGALAQQQAGAPPPRGRLSTGQMLQQQAQTPQRTALLTSAVADMVDAAAEAPAPVVSTEAELSRDPKTMTTDCIVAPDTGASSDAAEPGAAPDIDCIVAPPPTLPGEAELVAPQGGGAAKTADPLAPNVAPDVTSPLIQTTELAMAENAVQTAEQVVAAGPDIQPLETAPPPVDTPEISLPAPAAETPDAPTPSAPSASASGETSAIENGRPADAARAETAKVDAPAADEIPAAPTDRRDPAQTVAQSSQANQAFVQRADAPIAQRLSFDAVAQLSAQILRRLEGRSTRFEMELHPADMGRVDVRLDIDDQGQLAARLAFDNPVAGADLRGRVDELRRQLEDAGFQLAQDAFSFAEREGSREQHQDQGGRRRLMVQGLQVAEAADLASQPSLRASMRAGVDVRI